MVEGRRPLSGRSAEHSPIDSAGRLAPSYMRKSPRVASHRVQDQVTIGPEEVQDATY